MRIKNNISVPNLSRDHGIVREQLGRSLEKLSSGCRINRAGDDATELTTSEEMHHQMNGLDQAMENANGSIGMTGADEGALAKVHSMLHHTKTLAIQAANGAYNSATKANIEEERLQLFDEIGQISASTDFNQIPLFDTEVPAEPFELPKKKDNIMLQVGHTQKEEMPVTHCHMSSKALKLDKTDFRGVGKANASMEYIGKTIWAMTTIRPFLSAAKGHLEHTHNSLGMTRENMMAYENGIRDTSTASEVTGLTSLNIVGRATQSIQAHSNSLLEVILRLLRA